MSTRTLTGPPSILPLYARAAASMIPGASLLPFVPGRGREVPEIDLTLAGVQPDAERVAAYARVCGFSLRDRLPATYPHVLAFPLHMAAMADGRFPFGAVGLVHIENRIVQHRPIALHEPLDVRVRTGKLEPHPRGRAFALLSEALVDGEPVWESVSRMLRRGGGGSEADTAAQATASTPPGAPAENAGEPPADGSSGAGAAEHPNAEWRLGEDLGRRYGAVSGDRNPIHMHALAAKPLGFPRAIAHGMWTKARCLAALEAQLPDAFGVEVRFRKPILLPARVGFTSVRRGEEIDFAVRDARKDTSHLEGRTWPLDDRRTPR